MVLTTVGIGDKSPDSWAGQVIVIFIIHSNIIMNNESRSISWYDWFGSMTEKIEGSQRISYICMN